MTLLIFKMVTPGGGEGLEDADIDLPWEGGVPTGPGGERTEFNRWSVSPYVTITIRSWFKWGLCGRTLKT
jgi:hypothetical protein